MKITFLVPYKGLSGGLKVVTSYANSFLSRGHDVSILYPKLSIHWKNKIKQAIKSHFFNYKDHLDEFNGELIEIPVWDSSYIPASDCYIATGWDTAEFLSGLKIGNGKKFYFIQHIESWAGDEKRVLETYKSDLIKITISEWLRTELESISGQSNIPVIPNGKDYMKSDYLGEGLHRGYDIGMIASNVSFKRADVGLKAIQIVQEKYPNLKIVVITPHKLNYELPMNTTLLISPTQDKIRETYLKTKIWISSSEKEGFCLPALESISLGCALVATDSLGIRDIIENEKSGILVKPNDPQLLADAILKVYEDKKLMNKMSVEGLVRSDVFSWTKSTSKFLDILESGK